MTKVLVTGAGGLLGWAIAEEFRRGYEVEAVGHDRLDITDPSTVRAVVDRVRPDVVINCAAYNDVDRAEHDVRRALEVNAFGVLALARVARDTGATFVHYSTDFVFDGTADRPYGEDDRTNPQSVYGSSKLLGDWFAADAGRFYVLRVESLFGGPGISRGSRRGSLGTIVDRITGGEEVPVFVDRTVSPSFTPDIAVATRALIERRASPGVYHCVNSGDATWADIASEAARLLGRPLHMRPLTLESVPLVARRPKYCALSNARLSSLGIRMPAWQDALARYLGSQSAS